MANKKKYRLTFETVVEVEALDESEASDKAETKRANGECEQRSWIEMVEETFERR